MRLVFDIETNTYHLDQLTNIWCIAVRDLDNIGKFWTYGPDEIEAALEQLQSADMLVAHNGLCFDIPAIKTLYPDFSTEGIKVFDTLVASRLIKADLRNDDWTRGHELRDMPKKLFGSHGLEAWGYRLGYKKGDFAKDTELVGV